MGCVTRFLIDEMFPPETCLRLVERGHDAVGVRDLGVNARPDREVAAAAVREGRALVTDNVKDFAAEHDVIVVRAEVALAAARNGRAPS